MMDLKYLIRERSITQPPVRRDMDDGVGAKKSRVEPLRVTSVVQIATDV